MRCLTSTRGLPTLCGCVGLRPPALHRERGRPGWRLLFQPEPWNEYVSRAQGRAEMPQPTCRPVSRRCVLAPVGVFVSQSVAALAGLHRLLLDRPGSPMPLWCHRMMPHVMLLAFVEIHDLLEPRPASLGDPAPWVLRRYRGCCSLSLILVHRSTQYSSTHWRGGLVEQEPHDLPFPLAATLLPHTW